MEENKRSILINFGFISMILIIPLLLFWAFQWYYYRTPGLPFLGPMEKTANDEVSYHKIPDFTFVNQTGESISSDQFNGKIIVANYFFTSCPSICPEMTKQLKRVQDRFSNRSDVKILSFTVDPETDNQEALSDYANRYGAVDQQWSFMTGDKKDLYKLARNGFLITALEGDGGPTDFIHSEKLVLVDQQKHIRGFYDGTDSVEVNKLIVDISKLE